MKAIVGLGNPGPRYRWTRHNMGFLVLDRLAKAHQISISTERFKSGCGTGWIDSRRVLLLKPMTFMNRSGEAVREAADYFKIAGEDLIVIHDDLDLALGRLRFKRRGGDGGHQGIRSIIEGIGKSTFVRLKVGIGRPPEGMDPADYVLSTFDEAEKELVGKVVSSAAESIRVMLLEGIETAMSRYQKRIEKGET